MGGKSSAFNSREYGRTEECITYLEKEFWLSQNEIKRFHAIFLQIHKLGPQHEFLITCDALLDFFDIDSNVIHKLIFGWLSVEEPLTFSFVEFVIAVCCFLTLREPDFGKFLFVLIDANHDGILEYSEVKDLINVIKQEHNVSNDPLMNVLAKLKADTSNSLIFDGTVSKQYFMTLFIKHTSLSHPFRQLKCDLRRKCLGESYWTSREKLMLLPHHLEAKCCDAAKYPLIAQDVHVLLAEMAENGIVRYKGTGGELKTQDGLVLRASLDFGESTKTTDSNKSSKSGKHGRHTLPALSPSPIKSNLKPSPAKAGQRATVPRAQEKLELEDVDGDDFLPTISNLSKQASMRSRNKVISRQSSHDDMLDASTNKLHKEKQGRSSKELLKQARQEARGVDDSLHMPHRAAVNRRAVGKSWRGEGGGGGGGGGGGQLAPLVATGSRKIIRRRSSDDLLR
jgi:hypothetical protein